MRERPPPRPAIPFAVAFMAGGALADLGARPFLAAATCLLAGAAWRSTRRGFVHASLLFLVAALGASVTLEAERSARARVSSWLPDTGMAVEVEIRAEVLDVPELDPAGEARILVRGGPEARPGVGPIRMQLRVLASPETPTASVLALRPGDEVRAFCRLRLPRSTGDDELPDPRRSFLARGIDASGTVKSARLVERLHEGHVAPARVLGACKAALRERLDRTLGRTRARAVVGAMLLGDRAGLDPKDGRILRDTGLVHLISISGLHVGLAVALLAALLGRTRLGPLGVFAAIALSLAALSLLTGAQPPVVRSALAAGLCLLGRALGRTGDPLNTLAVVAAALVACSPSILWSVSFQLTIAATAGLLLFARPIASVLPFPRWLSLSIALSVSAYLTSTPIVLVHFGRAAPASILANLGASAFCVGILASGSAAIVLAGVPHAGSLAGWAAVSCVEGMFHFASAVATLPGAAFRVAAPGTSILLVYYAFLACAARRSVSGSARRIVHLITCLTLGVMHLGPLPPGRSPDSLVAALDVGQGQAVVLRGPTGGFVLVDAGGTSGGRFDAGERVVVPFLARRGCRRLEVLLITHGHEDHAAGAFAVLRELEVGELWVPVGSLRLPVFRSLAARAREQGTAIVLVERGFSARRAGMELAILHPTRADLAFSENDRSAVLHAGLLERSILVPGDLQAAGESELLASSVDPAAEVLVVGHHGGASSSGAAFLDAVAPSLAIVSVGVGNRFGHPDPGTIARLASRGASIRRTDRDGRILLLGGTRGWRVETALRGSGSEGE